MKRKYSRIAIIVLTVLLAALIGWRIWPRSLEDIISADKSSIIQFSAAASMNGFKEGEPYFDAYNLNGHQTDAEVLKEVLEILDSSAYQPDFCNLLPWHIDSVEADKNYDGCVALVVLGWGSKKEDYAEIQFLSRSLMVVKQESDSEFMVYHPTDRKLLDSLIAYIQKNGDKS